MRQERLKSKRPKVKMGDQMPSKAKEIRIRSNLTMQRISTYSGVCPATILRIEKGEPGVNLSSLVRVAYAYGCAPVELYPGLDLRPAKPLRFDYGDLY